MSAVDIEQDVERKRFEGFSMPMNMNMNRLSMPPLPTSAVQAKKKHGRSHSRNLSLTVPPLGPLPSNGQRSPSPSPLSPSPSATPTTPGFPGKRSSHHRRLSSVSTRHESAEIMGVTIPDLPSEQEPAKDSIRRRALLALEGKPDSYREVEIPQLPADGDLRPFEFPTKPSFPPGSGLGSTGSFKRDSFKLLASGPSNKDTLGTLVEEEEEEEHTVSLDEPVAPVSAPPTEKRKRPSLRPLSLTPESLNGSIFAAPDSVTPPAAAETRSAPLRLKTLSLAAIATLRGSPKPDEQFFRTPSPSTADDTSSFQSTKGPGQSFRLSQSFRSPQSFRSDDNATDTDNASYPFRAPQEPIRSSPLAQHSSTEAFEVETDGEEAHQAVEHVGHTRPPSVSSDAHHTGARPELNLSRPSPSKRSSISYKSSDEPEEHRLSTLSSSSSRSSLSSSGNWFNQSGGSFRDDESDINTPASSISTFSASWGRRSSGVSLSASEQHFLFKSHNTLLARIQDLEKALSVRHRDSLAFNDRPMSMMSTTSSYPDDELTQLRAERDELKSDVAGWRKRVADLEKQLSTLASRVELERREAWVARSRVGLLDAEKTSLERLLNEARSKADEMQELLAGLESSKEDLTKRVEDLVEQTKVLQTEKDAQDELNAELMRRIEQLESENERLKTQMVSSKRLIADQSFGYDTPSEESSELPTPFDDDQLSLAAVLNDSEDSSEVFGHHLSNKAFGAVYELDSSDDEDALATYEDEEADDIDDSMTSSSYGSPIATSRLGEMSQGWTFPKFSAPQPSRPITEFAFPESPVEEEEEHFMDSPSYSLTSSVDAFKRSLHSTPEDAFAFATPAGVGSQQFLGTVLEEEEEEEEEEEDYDEEDCSDEDPTWDGQDEDVFGDIGGIRIMLTPADADEPAGLGLPIAEEPESFPVSPIEEDVPQPSKSYRKPVPVYEPEAEQVTPKEQFVFQTPPKPRPVSISRLPRAVKQSPASPQSPREGSSAPSTIAPSRIPQKVGSPTFYRAPRAENGSPSSRSSPTLIRRWA